MDYTLDEIKKIYRQLDIETDEKRQKYDFGNVIDDSEEQKYVITSGAEISNSITENAYLE